MSTLRISLPRPTSTAGRLHPAPRTCSRPSARLVVRANIGKYLGDAAASIFSPTTKVSRNEELSKLRRLHDTLVSTRQQVAGCTDPDASNFDINASLEDGTCTYIFQPEGSEPFKGTVGNFISSTLESVWGSNFHTGDSNPPSFEDTTYTWGGDKVSQRDIQRLLEFERVVKKTLDEAEDDA